MRLSFDMVDVFTDPDVPGFSGNPLAVVYSAEDLADDQLQGLAAEFGFSETTFPHAVVGSGYAVRIFTPEAELPFAGHPTLGTAWALADRGEVTGRELLQRCGAGEIGVRLDADGAHVELTARPGDLAGPLPEDVVTALLADIGLAPGAGDGDVWVSGAGLDFVHLPVTADALARARPGRTPLAELLAGWAPAEPLRDQVGGLDVYAPAAGADAGPVPLEIRARVFVPELAVPEDPATGSSAAGLGPVLAVRGLIGGDGAYEIRQGVEMGRPSRLAGRLSGSGTTRRVHVRGAVAGVATGTIRVPARRTRG